MTITKSALIASTLLSAVLCAPAPQPEVIVGKRQDVAVTPSSSTTTAQSQATANAAELSAASAAASAFAPPGVSVVTVVVTLTPSAAPKPSSEASSTSSATSSSTAATLPTTIPGTLPSSQSSSKPITYRPPPPPPPPPKGFGQVQYGQAPVPRPVVTVQPAYSQQAAGRPYPRPASAGPNPYAPSMYTTTITKTMHSPQKTTVIIGAQSAATYAPRPAQAMPHYAPRPAPVPARPQPRPRPAQPRPYQPPVAAPIPQAYQPTFQQPYQQQPYPQQAYPQQPYQQGPQPYNSVPTAAEEPYGYPVPVPIAVGAPEDGDHTDYDLAPPAYPALSEEAGIYQELGPVILPEGLLEEAESSSADVVVVEPADED